MANEIIRPTELPARASPVASEVTVSDNGSSVAGVTWENGVNAAVPVATRSKAEAGTDNYDRMTSLATKQAIDYQVDPKISTAIGALNLGSMSQENASDYTPTSGLAAVALSNQYSSLDGLPTLGSAAASDVSDFATAAQGLTADTAVQPGDLAAVATSGDYDDLSNKPTARLLPAGGLTSQSLIKSSDSDYDVEWATSAAATAVSYAPQTLTGPQQAQARDNIGLGNSATRNVGTTAGTVAAGDDPRFGGWNAKPLFEPFPLYINPATDGALMPTRPTTPNDPVYIQLTMGLTGPGGYNEGHLTGETVSGSAPDNWATATIDVVGSPKNGAEIELINSSGAFLRPGASAGGKQVSANKAHNHSGSVTINAGGSHSHTVTTHSGSAVAGKAGTGTTSNGTANTSTAPNHTHTGSVTIDNSAGENEVRVKNVSAVYFMRVR